MKGHCLDLGCDSSLVINHMEMVCIIVMVWLYLFIYSNNRYYYVCLFSAGSLTYDEVGLSSIEYGRWFTLGLDVLVRAVL